MKIFKYILARFSVKLALVGSIVPILLIVEAMERLVALGLPRSILGPIVTVLMIAYVIALLVFIASQIDWS